MDAGDNPVSSLSSLYLHTNQLSGSIPKELGKLTKLRNLYLHTNELSEAIPAELGKLTQLTTLWLHNNQLSEAIPAELGDLTQLTDLRLYNNMGYRNAVLSGDLPSSLSSLTSLTELHLQNTQLTVPSALDTWASTRIVTTGTAASSGTIALDAANTVPDRRMGERDHAVCVGLFTADQGVCLQACRRQTAMPPKILRWTPTTRRRHKGCGGMLTTLWVAERLNFEGPLLEVGHYLYKHVCLQAVRLHAGW